MSWRIAVHEDEIRLELFKQGHCDWINDAIKVVCTCHCTIHKVKGSSVLTRYTCRHCNTTTTKGSSDDNSSCCTALSLDVSNIVGCVGTHSHGYNRKCGTNLSGTFKINCINLLPAQHRNWG
ncbi:hypothetical protein ILYODFUR_036862 [Ilyodon furcidens]|uniref:Uncharacterized protein n=1 Tax=Ilyodon furcidens TaxID=33524 RepID=A0ABV0UM37_9TELE